MMASHMSIMLPVIWLANIMYVELSYRFIANEQPLTLFVRCMNSCLGKLDWSVCQRKPPRRPANRNALAAVSKRTRTLKVSRSLQLQGNDNTTLLLQIRLTTWLSEVTRKPTSNRS